MIIISLIFIINEVQWAGVIGKFIKFCYYLGLGIVLIFVGTIINFYIA